MNKGWWMKVLGNQLYNDLKDMKQTEKEMQDLAANITIGPWKQPKIKPINS